MNRSKTAHSKEPSITVQFMKERNAIKRIAKAHREGTIPASVGMTDAFIERMFWELRGDIIDFGMDWLLDQKGWHMVKNATYKEL